jgi:hypothetical protein
VHFNPHGHARKNLEMPRIPEIRETIEFEFKGRCFVASYTTSSGMVHVSSLYGRKSAQLSNNPTASIARSLFGEIIYDADAEGILR